LEGCGISFGQKVEKRRERKRVESGTVVLFDGIDECRIGVEKCE